MLSCMRKHCTSAFTFVFSPYPAPECGVLKSGAKDLEMISRFGSTPTLVSSKILSVFDSYLPKSGLILYTHSSSCRSGFRKMSSDHKPEAGASAGSSHGANKLQFEKSPYLLQHQHNPVEWYPWGEEAFELAAKRKLPIFLSVGYSTCHWCHVMERESFENHEVAQVMNKHFVNIKVDREERPDVDRLYMTFVQAVSGSGGWPMSVWMTPDLKPFYGGTYYPPDDSMYGRPGFKSLLLTIAEQWKEESAKFVNSADKILQVLKRTAMLPVQDKPMVAKEISERCVQQLGRAYEPAFGGFSDHPKFPQPVNLNFLIHYRKNQPDHASSLKMIERTLKFMAAGGIYDHVGKGFCRYSTDKKWHVPHFEKMLYDNAQLTVTYSEAYSLTKDEAYARVAKEILEYVSRDMSHEEGGFYSAEDADSYDAETKRKAEGAFYVWTRDEIVSVLGDAAINDKVKILEIFEWRYGVGKSGNVDPRQDPHGELTNKNVLYLGHTVEETAKHFNILPDEVKRACTQAKSMLFEHRNKTRTRPGLDTKFITSWNCMMISAYTKAGIIFSNHHYLNRAILAMNFVRKYLISKDEDVIRTCYRDGDTNSSPVTNLTTVIMGCVDDFANLVAANLDLFDATSDLKYLKQAIHFQKLQDRLFWDSEQGGYFNSRMNSDCIVRFKDDDDGAEPSSNSISALNLIRLSALTENQEFSDKTDSLFKQFGDRLTKIPMSLPFMTAAFQAYSNGPVVVIALSDGTGESDTLKQIRSRLFPLGSTVVSVNVSGGNLSEWFSVLPYMKEKVDNFSSLKTDELVYLKQGTKFTTFGKAEIGNLLAAL